MNLGNTITIHERTYKLHGTPMDQYWQISGNRPALSFSSSPLDLGYVARWELRNERLYLLYFDGQPFFGSDVISFESQFPAGTYPLFAFWYCGSLAVQAGNVVFRDYHFGVTLEYTMNLTFENGVLRHTSMMDTR